MPAPARRRPRLGPASLLALAATAGVLAAACTPGEPAPPRSPTPTAASTTPAGPGSPAGGTGADLGAVDLALEEVAVAEQPVAMAVRDGDDALYVAEKTGRVVALMPDGGPSRAVLDLTGQVTAGWEQGLLGIAFSPDGDHLYVDYTDRAGDTRVDAFPFDGRQADPAGRREILFVDQPFANHNGGDIAFGPDGDLYVALGDGGSGGDPMRNGQDRSTLLGSLLRITPTPAGTEPYDVPPDNPFVGREGARPEIWAYGLRNPWRFSFDGETGDLWIGDVGQSAREEVDVERSGSPGGANYGWSAFEGTLRFDPAVPEPADAVPPVFEYPTGGGTCAITGGYVYRGSAIADLVGAYVFGDFCDGRLQAFVLRGDRARDHRFLGPTVQDLASFGQDGDGELYVLSLSGPVYRLVDGSD